MKQNLYNLSRYIFILLACCAAFTGSIEENDREVVHVSVPIEALVIS